MRKEATLTASIVLFKEDVSTLKKTISSFLKSEIEKKIFLIDNSPTDKLKAFFIHPDIEYIFNGKNLGFGKGHNIILSKLNSKFHLILNPDVEFKSNVLILLQKELEQHSNVAFITPKVLYSNGVNQFICRKHPTFVDLFNRKINFSRKLLFKNEYRTLDLRNSFYPDFIHGCFMFFRTQDFINLKGFDEQFFLYLEDADICRRIDKLGKKKLYFPKVNITHQHRKGSSKSMKLFFIHSLSAIKYFLKWGF